jgi:hypothetical protein
VRSWASRWRQLLKIGRLLSGRVRSRDTLARLGGGERSFSLGVSIGIVAITAASGRPADVLRAADEAQGCAWRAAQRFLTGAPPENTTCQRTRQANILPADENAT